MIMLSTRKAPVRLLGILAIAMAAMAAPVLAQEQGPPLPPENTPLPPAPPVHVQNSAVPAPQRQTSNAPLPAAPPEHTGTVRHVAPRNALALANVNLRAGPSTATEIVATIPGGSNVKVSGCTGEWCAASWAGRSGFVIARALDTGGPNVVRHYRPPPRYGREVVEVEPRVVYGPPPPVVVYGPGYYYGPSYYYYRPWRRHWR
jgi:Bacterial SH3 domain